MKLYRKLIRPMHCYPGQSYEPKTEPVEKEEKWYPEEEREHLEEKYGYFNEGSFSDLIFEEKFEPYAVEERETARIDIPEIATIKIKRQIPISATRCLVCGTWECPDFDHELYDAVITGETAGLCESCRKAVLRAKEHMNDSN